MKLRCPFSHVRLVKARFEREFNLSPAEDKCARLLSWEEEAVKIETFSAEIVKLVDKRHTFKRNNPEVSAADGQADGRYDELGEMHTEQPLLFARLKFVVKLHLQ
jgi:hypothetical protein